MYEGRLTPDKIKLWGDCRGKLLFIQRFFSSFIHNGLLYQRFIDVSTESLGLRKVAKMAILSCRLKLRHRGIDSIFSIFKSYTYFRRRVITAALDIVVAR